MKNEREYRAIIKDIRQGRHDCDYAVVELTPLVPNIEGSITFALKLEVWQDYNEMPKPEGGTVVIVSGVYRKVAGWRARKARLYRPEDEERFKRKE